MKKIIIKAFCLLLFIPSTVLAWDFSTRFDASSTSTSNVTSSNTNEQKDSYTTFSAYAQTKEEPHRFRLKVKSNRYKKYDENDSNFFELSYQFKPEKHEEYIVSAFQEKYVKTPSISTDTSSSNRGARLQANFSKDLRKTTLGYINTSLSYKKYTELSPVRTDFRPEVIMGLEENLSKDLVFIPELSLGANRSKDNDYSTLFYGPSAILTWSPSDYLELFTSASYLKTRYSNRVYSYQRLVRTYSEKEEQSLTSYEVGGLVTLFEKLVISAKYISYNNQSNDPSNTYKSNDVLFGIGFRY